MSKLVANATRLASGQYAAVVIDTRAKTSTRVSPASFVNALDALAAARDHIAAPAAPIEAPQPKPLQWARKFIEGYAVKTRGIEHALKLVKIIDARVTLTEALSGALHTPIAA